MNKSKQHQVFSAQYKGYDLALNQPSEDSIKVFDEEGTEVMCLALSGQSDDLVKGITIIKEIIDKGQLK